MVGHVRGRDCVACRASNLTSCWVKRVSGRRVGSEGSLPSLVDRSSTSRPRTRDLQRSARAIIFRIRGGEQRKDMLRTIRSPACD
jgi:hypothetical protein